MSWVALLRKISALLLSLAISTFPGCLFPLMRYRSLASEAEDAGMPFAKLALLVYFQWVPWPFHGLNRVESLRGRAEGSESAFLAIFLLRTPLLILGASSMMLLFPRKQVVRDGWPTCLKEFCRQPGGIFILLLLVAHATLMAGSIYLYERGAVQVYLYAAPYFLPIYFAWVVMCTFTAGILLFLGGVSDGIL